jgi:TonB family protein
MVVRFRWMGPLALVVLSVGVHARELGSSEPLKGPIQVDGDTRWTVEVEQKRSPVCSLKGDKRRFALGPNATAAPRPDSKDCVETILWVQNHSPRPIQCNIRARLPRPDERNATSLDGDLVLFPADIDFIAKSVGPAASAPTEHELVCRIYPAEYEKLQITDDCKLNFDFLPNPDAYYPPGARRREEAGAATLDFSVDNETHRFVDIRIARSSGFRELDMAAIKLGKAARATSTCPSQHSRFTLKFRIN